MSTNQQEVSMHGDAVAGEMDEKETGSFEVEDSKEKSDHTDEEDSASLLDEVLEILFIDDEKNFDHEAIERENEEKRIKQLRCLEQLAQKHPSRQTGMDTRLARHENRLATARARVAAAYDGRWTNEQIAALQIEHLPCSASEFFQLQRSADGRKNNNGHSEYRGWAPPLKTVLIGTRSIKKIKSSSASSPEFSCPLSLLRGYETELVARIFSYIRSPYDHVRFTIPAALVGVGSDRYFLRFVKGRTTPEWRERKLECRVPLTSSIPASVSPSNATTKDNKLSPLQSPEDLCVDKKGAIADAYISFVKVGDVNELFPPPKDRNVNMMPFILGDVNSLPSHLQDFYPLVDACPWVREEQGNVAYLTVQETAHVEEGETQRRPGLHIESPGVFADSSFLPCSEHPWGCGHFYPKQYFDHYEGGIYIASNVDHSTVLFDALVDRSVPGMVDRHGGCEYLRPIFPETKATQLKAGELVWMTDCTVHEAGPQLQAGPRTFFRLVMPSVSHWYAAHSTPNPKVSLPDGIVVIEDCKFAAVEKN